MNKDEEHAKKRICVRCELPCPTSRMHFHHDTEMECIKLLREQVEALKPYAILSHIRIGDFIFSENIAGDVTYGP